MTVLILIFLVLTGGAPPVEDGTSPTGSPTVTTTDPADETTNSDGGDYVRKSPIG